MGVFLYLILFFFFGTFHYTQACTNQTIVSCSFSNSSTRLILVWGIQPTGNCSMVTIGNLSYIFDPIMINYVWITLNNPDVACIANIFGRSQNISSALGLSTTQDIVLLDVTPLYYRMVFVTKKDTANYVVNQFSEEVLKRAKLQLYPIFNDLNQYGPFCLNNGVIDLTYTGAGYKCICSGNVTFFGAACEYLETRFTSPMSYFNIFSSPTTINVKLSIYSTGIIGTNNILSIKNSIYQNIVELYVVESALYLKTESLNIKTINTPIDHQTWHDVYIIVTQQNATLALNSSSISISFVTQLTSDFRAFYMIINENSDNVTNNIAMKTAVVSGKVIDFFNPKYQSACITRCPCTANQICSCRPFISLSQSFCYCKLSYLPSSVGCVPNNIPYSSITSSTIAQFPIGNVSVATVDFGFQTLSVNGMLLSITLSTSTLSIVVQIVNSNLMLSVSTLAGPLSILYNVSNGQIHNVTLNIKPYLLEMILDSNYNYTKDILYWTPNNSSIPYASTLTIGPMQLPFNSTINNLTTCFSVIRLNGIDSPMDISTSISPQMSPQCLSGPRCTSNTVTCASNQGCRDNEWQNTKCICNANFTSVNSTCIYNQSINASINYNPCLNGGQCYYNSALGNYSCACTNGYTGVNCESVGLWWIAVLVVLLLLLIGFIILLVYCCRYRNRNPDTIPFIIKINENIISYNEQAGESDYNGPPINFALMQNALKSNGAPAANGVVKEIPNLMNKKEEFDKNNADLILDHPLEYGYEDDMHNDNVSISSIGSKSGSIPFDESDVYDWNGFI